MIRGRSFANSPGAVTEARRFALSSLAGVPTQVAEEVGLMVSELTTNSVRHAHSSFVIHVDCDERRVYVSVTDAGPGEPVVQHPAPSDPTGRGLQIVRAVADDWGVEPARGEFGKTVWFSLRLPLR
jgi:anti-sigma regulatory factor (Ser/Thr protein kinase)